MMENLFDNLVLAVTLISTVASLVLYLSMVSGITEGVKVSENSDSSKDMDDTVYILWSDMGKDHEVFT